ncbi:hypothetical protein CsSME_00034994 [Camellia sinensis var. sinensis]
MEFLKENIGKSLKPLSAYCTTHLFVSSIGLM